MDQVRQLAAVHANRRARNHLPASETMLLGYACSLPFQDYLVVLRRWMLLADPDGSARGGSGLCLGGTRQPGSRADRQCGGGPQCRWPGCGRSRWHIQVDHCTEWAEHGVTAPRNGGLLCGRHNRWKSRGYRVFRDSAGCWHLLRPDGTELDQPRAA